MIPDQDRIVCSWMHLDGDQVSHLVDADGVTCCAEAPAGEWKENTNKPHCVECELQKRLSIRILEQQLTKETR